MKIKTKQITVTAIMLAICLVSQFFKNLSVYITGPIINAALILTVLYAGMACGIILCLFPCCLLNRFIVCINSLLAFIKITSII